MPVEIEPVAPVLHAVRLLGFADAAKVARQLGGQTCQVEESLLDAEAAGWVVRSQFAGTAGWSLTDRGRAEDGRRLSAELDASGARPTVTEAHATFLPLNAQVLVAVTRWQLRPLPGDPMAGNDHTDHRWDDRVLATLTSVGSRLGPLNAALTSALPRFAGYHDRYLAALVRATRGEHDWVDGMGIDSCHAVWMQLHEDLLATLGLERGAEG